MQIWTCIIQPGGFGKTKHTNDKKRKCVVCVCNSKSQHAKWACFYPSPLTCVWKRFVISKRNNLTNDRAKVATSCPRPLWCDVIAAGTQLVWVLGHTESSGADLGSRAELWMDPQRDRSGYLKLGQSKQKQIVWFNPRYLEKQLFISFIENICSRFWPVVVVFFTL